MKILCVLLAIALSACATTGEKKVTDGEFLAASGYLVAMTIFDVETTFAAIRNGAHEANPVMKPFVNNGRVATYAFTLAIDGLILWAAHEMRTSENKGFMKTWWILPGIAGTAHGVAGGLNLRFVR